MYIAGHDMVADYSQAMQYFEKAFRDIEELLSNENFVPRVWNREQSANLRDDAWKIFSQADLLHRQMCQRFNHESSDVKRWVEVKCYDYCL